MESVEWIEKTVRYPVEWLRENATREEKALIIAGLADRSTDYFERPVTGLPLSRRTFERYLTSAKQKRNPKNKAIGKLLYKEYIRIHFYPFGYDEDFESDELEIPFPAAELKYDYLIAEHSIHFEMLEEIFSYYRTDSGETNSFKDAYAILSDSTNSDGNWLYQYIQFLPPGKYSRVKQQDKAQASQPSYENIELNDPIWFYLALFGVEGEQ